MPFPCRAVPLLLQVAIEQMSKLHASVPQLRYEWADTRSMPQYPDGAFGGVLDKGTLDALL